MSPKPHELKKRRGGLERGAWPPASSSWLRLSVYRPVCSLFGLIHLYRKGLDPVSSQVYTDLKLPLMASPR